MQLHKQSIQKENVNMINKSVQTTNNIVINNGKEEEQDEICNEININKLQLKIVSLQELIANLQNEKRIESATEGLQIMLNTAKNMINEIKEQQKQYTLHINAKKLKYNSNSQKNAQMILSQLQNNVINEMQMD